MRRQDAAPSRWEAGRARRDAGRGLGGGLAEECRAIAKKEMRVAHRSAPFLGCSRLGACNLCWTAQELWVQQRLHNLYTFCFVVTDARPADSVEATLRVSSGGLQGRGAGGMGAGTLLPWFSGQAGSSRARLPVALHEPCTCRCLLWMCMYHAAALLLPS